MRISKSSITRNDAGFSIRTILRVLGGVLAIAAVWDIFTVTNSMDPVNNPFFNTNNFERKKPTIISPYGTSIKKKDGKSPREMQFFHHYRKGYSGGVIEDMLMCHAYAFHLNATYGGSCGEPSSLIQTHQELLSSVGLKHTLKFACPRDSNNTNIRSSVIPKDNYLKDDTLIWTPDYVDYLKSHVEYAPKVPDKFTIAVHIRRAEVTPCRATFKGFDRYLPNLHYQNLINLYMRPGARVVIFSQSKSYEPFDSFREKGYEVILDDDVTDVWKTIAVADVVIVSRSSFSLVPSVVAKGTVVYTPFWHPPLRQWHVVDQNTLDISNEETERLKDTCPLKNKFGGDTFGAQGRQRPPGRDGKV
jgi:hypothetical protein